MARNALSIRAGVRIRKVLEDQQLTQEWLADATGIPMRTLARRLHKINPSPIDIEELGAVAEALGVELGHLVAAESPIDRLRAQAVAS